MPLDPDALIDRRRLKRRLAAWRALAVVALVAAILAGLGRFGEFAGDYVARFEVEGVIVDDAGRDRLLDAIARDASARALIVRIDSPGGTVVGGEALYLALARVAQVKPVVAVLGTMATSGAYMGALAADRLFAREGTITGSIGVILQTAEITELLANIGISTEAIKSSPLKGTPSPLEPLSEAARAASQAVVTDVYARFVDLVAERRGLDPARAGALADGRVFSGRQALDAGLIDALGGESEARAWLAAERGIDESLPARDLEVESSGPEWLGRIASSAGKTILPEPLVLDGLISVWHPWGP